MFEETIKASIELWRDRGNLQIGLAAEFRGQDNFISMLTACNWARQCFDHMDKLIKLEKFLKFVPAISPLIVFTMNLISQRENEIPDSSQLSHVVAQH